jgi:hypothetical protein
MKHTTHKNKQMQDRTCPVWDAAFKRRQQHKKQEEEEEEEEVITKRTTKDAHRLLVDWFSGGVWHEQRRFW